MQNAQLQAMTVVQLRKLAKENGVKLSAGIDKSGIVARLSEALPDEPAVQPSPPEQAQALHEPAPEPEPAPEAPKEDASPAQTQEKLQEAPLSADVTAVSPGSSGFRPWNNPQEQGGFRPVYRQAWQARSTSRDTAQTPAWQQRAAGTVNRFGPPAPHIPREAGRTPGAAPADRGVYCTSGSPGKRAQAGWIPPGISCGSAAYILSEPRRICCARSGIQWLSAAWWVSAKRLPVLWQQLWISAAARLSASFLGGSL